MSPPQLPADAPVLNVVHPVEVGLRPVFRYESDSPALDGLDGRFGQRFDIDIPLIGQIGFHDCAAAIAPRNIAAILLDLFKQIECIEIGNDLSAGFRETPDTTASAGV